MRNFQVFSALDFLAEVTQHIPEKGSTWFAGTDRLLESGRREQLGESAELQLVLDPDFL